MFRSKDMSVLSTDSLGKLCGTGVNIKIRRIKYRRIWRSSQKALRVIAITCLVAAPLIAVYVIGSRYAAQRDKKCQARMIPFESKTPVITAGSYSSARSKYNEVKLTGHLESAGDQDENTDFKGAIRLVEKDGCSVRLHCKQPLMGLAKACIEQKYLTYITVDCGSNTIIRISVDTDY